MFGKKIEFLAHEDYVSLKEDLPTPIKLNIPGWYKKLEHTIQSKTIKGCMPFLDTLTTGYLLKVPQDYSLKFNVKNENGEFDTFFDPLNAADNLLNAKSINFGRSFVDFHNTKQIKGSPYVEKNKNQSVLKIMNPWIIKTPPGYSCLFVPPLNNTDDRFSIIPGIVDTDVFPNEINFPVIFNGDKYPTLETVIEKGTPYVQVIPFKRDNWKMNIKPVSTNFLNKGKILYYLKYIHIYKNKYWFKKKWN